MLVDFDKIMSTISYLELSSSTAKFLPSSGQGIHVNL